MKKAAVIFAVLLFWTCSTNPLTGRQSLSLVSNAQLFPQAFAQYDQVLKESQIDKTSADAKMINNVGQRIKYAAEKFYAEQGMSQALQGYAWEFTLIKNDQLNAWCMPGGKVAFYTGIMPVCQDETGIAVVMGHEVAHAIANHSRERMSQGLVANGLLGGLQMAMGENPSLTKTLFLQAVGIGGQVGMLKFSRDQELEADQLGLIFMAIAGYDPQEAPRFWERMQAKSGGGAPPEFLSTHPGPDRRIDQLNKQMPNALKYYKK